MTWSISANGKKADVIDSIDQQMEAASDPGARAFGEYAKDAIGGAADEQSVSVSGSGHTSTTPAGSTYASASISISELAPGGTA